MPSRKRISVESSALTRGLIKSFILHCRAKGLSDKTIATYEQHFSAIEKHIDLDKPIQYLCKSRLEEMICSMRDSGLSANSIKSYTRTLSTFFSWCREEEIANLHIPLYKAEETIKETYTDSELEILLVKPNSRTCMFSEYRNWVIINLLLNNGCRAASIRNIKIKDLDFDNRVIYLRHTKNKRAQAIPLCDALCMILKEYLRIRGGSFDDYLFPNQYGEQMTENGLRCTIAKYNKRRGVEKTSIHMFRHTFAKKFLIDCGGDAFALQHLLGHSTLDMTKHYCAIFDADVVKNFENFSPLVQMTTSHEKITMKNKKNTKSRI